MLGLSISITETHYPDIGSGAIFFRPIGSLIDPRLYEKPSVYTF